MKNGTGFWIYRQLTKAYQKFPSYSLLRLFVPGYFFIPKGIPATSYVFQKLISVSKIFENEGMFFIWLFHPILVLFSEEALKVFSYEKAAIDKPYHYEILASAMGKGTITRNGEDWKKHRKMFNPVFYTNILQNSTSTINEYASIMIKKLATVTNKPVDLLDHFKEFSLYAVGGFLLGIKMHEGKPKELGEKFRKVVAKLSGYTIHRVCHPWMRYKFFLQCSGYGRDHLKWYNERDGLISEFLSEMKEAIYLRSSETKSVDEIGTSFADALLQQNLKDPSFTIKDMEDEIFTYLAAGFDTVAYTLLWCLFLLGHHQDIQNKVFKEVQSTTGEFITYDDIFRLKYLECIIKETLRLYPAVPVYGRHLKEDVQCGKYKVPKGTSLAFFPYRLHRNPDVFPNPENFIPERFLDGSIEKRPWVYVPFAEGTRSCIGKKFAKMELTIFLAYIIRTYEIKSLVERESVEYDWAVTLMPVKPLFMQLTPRNDNVK